MDVREFESRILGETIDISIRHKDADSKAILFRVGSMPIGDTLVRLANEIRVIGEGTPCYLQAEGRDAIDIGYIDVRIDVVKKCKSILEHNLVGVYWVNDGAIESELLMEDLISTVKFKVGGDISEYI